MTRPIRITGLGRRGILTDLEPWQQPGDSLFYSQDAVFSQTNNPSQRRGWKYMNQSNQFASLYGVWRAKFSLRGITRTYVSGASTASNLPASAIGYLDPSTSTLLTGVIFTSNFQQDGQAVYLPRAMYNDQLLFCDQSGLGARGVIRVSGSINNPTIIAGAPTFTAGEATLTGATYGVGLGAPEPGMFQTMAYGNNTGGNMVASWRLDAGSATSLSLEGVRASATIAPLSAGAPGNFGQIIPCVSVYNTGTVTCTAASFVITGFGTKWISDTDFAITNMPLDIALVNDSGTYRGLTFQVSASSTDTSVATQYNGATITKASYDVLRYPRFKDVAAHKNSLYGTGIAQFPSRVYVGPPGWNMSAPPGAVLPFDPSIAVTATARSYFLMLAIDVPSTNDSDPVVALLSTPGPLLVLKRSNTFAIDGFYPDLSPRMYAPGAGCLDLRSAISLDEGQFWCGENAIYQHQNGRLADITDGKRNAEWRAMANNGFEFVTTGIAYGYFVVSFRTLGQPNQGTTWAYNLTTKAWETNLTNTNPRMIFSARVSGEVEQLLMVQDSAPGRVINLRPAFDGTGGARDDDGTSPAMLVRTGNVLSGQGDVDQEGKILGLAASHNIKDSSGGSSTVDVNVVTEGQVGVTPGFRLGIDILDGTGYLGPGSKKTAMTLTPHTYDGNQRVPSVGEATVNRAGRLAQVELRTTLTAASNEKIEVHEVALSVRDSKSRS